MLSTMIQCGITNIQKAILLLKMQPYKDDTFYELGGCALIYKIACFSFYHLYLSLSHLQSLYLSVPKICVLLLSFLYSLCRYGTLLGNLILMLLLFIHNIIKSVPSGRVHFLIILSCLPFSSSYRFSRVLLYSIISCTYTSKIGCLVFLCA